MANTAISDLINKAARLVVDKNMVRWDKDFWILAYNAATKAVLAARPDALVEVSVVTLVEGTTQEIPDNARYVIDVHRNEQGTAITGPIDMQQYDNYKPEWRATTGSSQIDAWFYDDRTPEYFFVYPGAAAGTKIEISLALEPGAVTVLDYENNLPGPLGPMYDNAIVQWLIYEAFNENSEIAGNQQRAAEARSTFELLLGIKSQADAAIQQENERSRNKQV